VDPRKLDLLDAVMRDPALAATVSPESYVFMPPPSEPVVVGEDNRAIWEVLALAAADMRRLSHAGEELAVRNLCYALHNLPPLLLRPASFDPNRYMFCMRFAAFRWALLSPELN
jgi:hypothetical protein